MTDNLTAKTGDKNVQDCSSLMLRIKKLEDELSIIHQSGFISSVPVGTRIELADRLMQQGRVYSVYEMSEALEFSRGTYYISNYNRLRPHIALNYKTPDQVEEAYSLSSL